MGYTFSLFLMAVGAVLRYAINNTSEFGRDFDLDMIGLILMILGLVGLLITLGTHLFYRDDIDRYDREPVDEELVERDPLRPVRRRRRRY